MKMKGLINNPENLTSELLEGFMEAHKDLVVLGENKTAISKNPDKAGRATIAAQGGSGHEPAINGFIGDRMVDVSVVGDVFAAPGPRACVSAIELADKGKGVFYIVLNHTSDMLTGSLTVKKCAREGLRVVKMVTQGDVSNTPRSNTEDRRGLVRCIPTHKTAGAAAAEGKNLEEVAAVTQRFVDNTATLAVAVSGTVHPATGSLLVDLGEDGMKIGMGQHGEGGGRRQPLKSAGETVVIMIDALLVDIGVKKGERAMLVLSGISTTTLMGLFILYRRCTSYLREKNIEVVANYVGELLTMQEQGGFQMSMARVDDELLHCWNVPCNTPYMKK